MWRVRLSEHVHKVYLTDVNFYKACNLGGSEKIDNADQRVTADIVQFCEELTELYTTVFKPLLDVLLFTAKMTEFLGWQAPMIMYGYFFVSGVIKRSIMPKFGRYIAHESQLEGTYRTCHNRLIVNSEEIAFYRGADKERAIITTALSALVRHSRRTRFLKFLVGIFDQLLVKYWASIAGYLGMLAVCVCDRCA
jgi:ATP-binding cassette subfamily D (ALD) protein 3